MFSPDLTETSSHLAGAFTQTLSVAGFARSAAQIRLSTLSPEPLWISPLRLRLAKLVRQGHIWEDEAPKIRADILTPFVTYASLIATTAQTLPALRADRAAVRGLLERLHGAAESCAAKTRDAATRLQGQLGALSMIEAELRDSLSQARAGLAHEIRQVTAIAELVGALLDRLFALQDGITAPRIAAGTTFYQTPTTISFTLAGELGREMPFLTLTDTIHSTEGMAYDRIVSDPEVAEIIDTLVARRTGTSASGQAAAMSEAVTRMIRRLHLQVAGLSHCLPALDRTWRAEAAKLAAALRALDGGADPATLIDLSTLPAAVGNWRALADLAHGCVTFPSQNILPGKAVALTTEQPAPQTIF
ncbi:hypothetical protein KM176_14770 [Pseudooceanicola sp. CBS1P-1]|uniref:Uncharacterized protein n=1 Tax=Pseudooceanicola albus TaxID=2692189 RepID=A0A6L7G4X6_9RHOB|nr:MULTISPECIES: hypothetical protein [Pseudooceanicola]MBT9385131.1 hypothetical protein [Pseudooceanicola endophyticus]MXN18577.1 hypothetical protein [Pseudooceanicola albus]